ncbi:MAG: hypothetical protein KKC80_05515 [Candidatus Margulisbacteria bacterium]|nr:hypothetical protein [Candidatus Margulisiibacteriota bacterium]MBU1617123.1 hypothetical protein [Candidatus Margulisiibacteriota bacterium]
MIYQIYLPKFGANIESGTITEWLKKENEPVTKGETLALIETSKAIFELEAEESGVLKKVLANAGQEVAFNQTIGIIAGPDEDITAVLAEIKSTKTDKSAEFVKEMDKGVFDVKQEGPVNNRKMTPAARRLVREKKISEDVLNAIEKEVIEEKDLLSLIDAGQIYIYGASTGCKQIMEILKSNHKYKILGIIDDNKEFHDRTVEAYKVLGGFEWLKRRYEENPDFGVMIASHSTNREKIYNKIKENMPGIKLPPIIDERAIIMSGVRVGESSLIEAGVILGQEVEIGKNVILNLGVKISHNSVVGDHSHVALGVSMSAAVVVGKNVFIGAGAAINPAVTIGENSMISPATAVLHDIPENVIVNGVPGKIVGESKRGKQ